MYQAKAAGRKCVGSPFFWEAVTSKNKWPVKKLPILHFSTSNLVVTALVFHMFGLQLGLHIRNRYIRTFRHFELIFCEIPAGSQGQFLRQAPAS